MAATTMIQLYHSTDEQDEYDAFADSLYNRGALMRKLRELERQDEELRRQEEEVEAKQQEVDEDETLNYEEYLVHQSYYDDYKHVNYKYINFQINGNLEEEEEEGNDNATASTIEQRRPKATLTIEQDRTVGKGGFVWDAGYILAEHVTKHQKEWRNTMNTTSSKNSIIELGAGTGITGLWVANSFPKTTNVHLTDLPELQSVLAKNTKESANASYGVLEWGVTNSQPQPSSFKYDVILGADVVASIYCADALAKTINQLSGPTTHVYLACRDRLEGTIDSFEQSMKQMFQKVERTKAVSKNRNPDVWIFYATDKRSNQ